jgi:hypothetical protein
MATTNVTSIQVLRSEVNNKRPDPVKMLSGQPAVNINANQPGFFFADDTGTSLIKIGPCAVGPAAPNANDPFWVNAPSPTSVGNTLGELWLDTAAATGPTLKVWDGTQWISAMPNAYANALVSDTFPGTSGYPDGTLWWNSATGLMYILYNDGATRQWVQTSAAPVS